MTYSPTTKSDPLPGSRAADPLEGRPAAYLLSGLFIFLGLAAILLFLQSVANDPGIQAVQHWDQASGTEQPSLILAFLSSFGVVLPTLILGLGSTSIWLGFQIRSQRVTIGRWAHMALMWLTVGSLAFTLLNIIRLLPALAASTETPVAASQYAPVLIFAAASVFFGLVFTWLDRHLDHIFHGQEALDARQTRLAWNLLIPTLIVFVIVAARPLEQTFIRSVTDKRFAGQELPNFVGLENYQSLLGIHLSTVPCRLDEATQTCSIRDDGSTRWESIDRSLLEEGYRTVWTIPLPGGDVPRALAISGLDSSFLKGIGTTLVFTIGSVTLELLIALFMAMTVNSSFAGRGLMRAVMLVPWAIPTVISARLWELMLKDTSAGIVNRVLMDLHVIDVPKAWLADVTLQLPAAIAVDVWKTAPFMALLLLAGLQTIPSDLYEAAAVDGATRARQFFSITLPLLRPTIGVALIFRTLDALRVFDLFNVLFGRQQLTMATYNYETLVNNQQDGYASAVSMIIFVLISIFAMLYVRLLNVESD